MTIISAENISFGYDAPIFENASFSIERGSLVLLCGESGCGKTTFLKLLKKELAPKGACSKNIDNIKVAVPSHMIGYVFQIPDNQFIYENVFDETTFGLSNLGLGDAEIKQRVCEFSNFLGTDKLMSKSVHELSGGEKQLVNLTSVMAMKPEILLLDEPAALLDPIARSEFANAIKRINEEYGTTVIVSEHSLEHLLPAADRILCINGGKIFSFDSAYDFIDYVYEKCERLIPSLPDSVRIGKMLHQMPGRTFEHLSQRQKYPLTVRDCAAYGDIAQGSFSADMQSTCNAGAPDNGSLKPVYSCKNLSYGYTAGNDILNNISLKLYEGMCTVITGGNGSGKTTLLKIMAGMIKHKKSKLYSSCCYIPQNPLPVFFKDTVIEDYKLMQKSLNLSNGIIEDTIVKYEFFRGIDKFFPANPYDLSGGELQLCAIFKAVLSGAKLLLLDEPEKGLDGFSRHRLSMLINSLKSEGISFAVASHDLNFASYACDTAIMLFNGEIVKNDNIRNFLLNNDFFTTDTCKITRSSIRAINCQEVFDRVGNNID